MKKAEAEVSVKVKRRTGSCLLNLSLSLNLPQNRWRSFLASYLWGEKPEG